MTRTAATPPARLRRPVWARLGLLRALATTAVLGLGCSINQVQRATSCQSDDQCGSGFACTGSSCVPKSVAPTQWAIELVPTSDSPAAPTELSTVVFGDASPVLHADAKMVVTGQVAPGSSVNGGSHVVATLPPVIPGRQDLRFEAEWAAPVENGTSQFSLVVPASVLGETAALRIVPLPPRDLAQPPVSLNVTLAPVVNVPFSSDYFFVTGRLVSSAAQPVGGFVARAFQSSQLISNVSPIADDGKFRLSILPGSTNGSSNNFVTIELAPTDSQGPDPRLTTHSISVVANVELGDVALPPFGTPAPFRFTVVDPSQQPVAGATVTVRTVFPNNSTGLADYVRAGQTDENGRIDLALLPGTSAVARPYDISVVPPSASSLAVTCVSSFPITAGGAGASGGPTAAASIGLKAKVALAGTILSATGLPVAGVSVSATRTAADPSEICADDAASPPASASSGQDGSYQLMVDPGTYRVDYDPPAGSPVPRLTETGVAVTSEGDLLHAVQMLPGALVRGTVLGPDGNGLPSTAVRFFEVVCSGHEACFGQNRVEPLLRAETHTDDAGNFSAVVPMQLPAPN